MKKLARNVTTLITVCFIMGLAVGCGNGKEAKRDYIRNFYNHCNGKVEAIYSHGTWGQRLDLKCKDIERWEDN